MFKLFVTSNMDVNSFSERVREKYEQLLNESKSREFDVSLELTDNVDVEFSGSRKNDDRWGDNNFAVDAQLDVTVQEEETWKEESDQVGELTESVKHVLRDVLGFKGPVIIRSTDDKCVRSWARRLIKTEEDEEETEETED